MAEPEPRIHLVNDRTLLLSFSHLADSMAMQGRLLALAEQLRDSHLCSPSRPEAALREIVPGPGNLLLTLATDTTWTLTGLTAELESRWTELDDCPLRSGRIVEIPVHYGGEDGPDLAAVAEHAGLSPRDVARRHAEGEYDVLCLGFQPGFPYLGGLADVLHMPRRSSPRPRIPAGSVAIGGDRTGIYPAETPGGWHIIGRTRLSLFNAADESSPTLLLPGDRIHFVMESLHV